jgi:octaprenyl-diphosphate synthase
MSTIKSIHAPIQEEMKKFNAFFNASMKSAVPLLNIITNYILRRKGKQMRPMFVFLSAKLHGEIGDSTYTAATLIELLHTATLIHDDVVDDSLERRGFFSINALWKSKIAVLIGDYLLARGMLLAVEKKEYELLEIVSGAVREMSEGELLQIQKSRKLNITESEYFDIIRKKTATLIAACSACGSKSVGANGDVVNRMKEFGKNVGIAFQIKDDLFDYQRTGILGKPTGNDIKEKKITLPLIHSLENSKSSEKRKILNLIRRHNRNSLKVKEIIRFVQTSGGIEYSVRKMHEYRDRALGILNQFPDNDAKNALKSLVNYTTSRDR